MMTLRVARARVWGALVPVLALCAFVPVGAAGLGSDAFTYQGRLTLAGEAVSASGDMTFSLFDGAESGATQIGSTHAVTNLLIENGLIMVDLDFGSGAFDGSERWIEIAVRSPHDPTNLEPFLTLSPRQPITPAPYAQFAFSAYGPNIIGLNASNITSGVVAVQRGGTGANTPSTALTSLNAQARVSDVAPVGQYIRAINADGTVVTGIDANTTYTAGVGLQLSGSTFSVGTSGITNSLLASDPLSLSRVSGAVMTSSSGSIGIGIASPDNTMHVHKATAGAITGHSNAPLVVENNTNTYINLLSPAANEQGILFGYPGAPGGPATGGIFYNSSSTLDGLQFRTDGNNTRMVIDSAGNVGIGAISPTSRLHLANSDTDIAVQLRASGSWTAGLKQTSNSVLSLVNGGSDRLSITAGGNVGIGTSNPNSPLHAVNSGSSRVALFNHTGTSGPGDGVESVTASAGAFGVWGRNTAVNGTAIAGLAGTGGRGVVGSASGTGSFGVYAQGNLGASGTKTFQIDHPLDPENTYLQHYSAEGPEPFNIYRGNAILDALGQAWVELPDYFEEINIDFHYQLTCIGSHAPVYIGQEIINNGFQIAGGQAGMKVSWMVTAVRNDPYVRANPTSDVVAKPEHERGKFARPELYGMPPERGINYRVSGINP